MPNLYGATGSRTAQGRPGSTSIDIPVLVDSRGRVITVPGAFYQSPSGLVRPRADNDGTQFVTEARRGKGKVVVVKIMRLANTTAYTANDVINDVAATMLKVRDVALDDGGSFLLSAIEVIGNQGNGGGAETWQPVIWLWREERLTVLADNDAFTASYVIQAQARKLDRIVLPALTAPAGSTIDTSQITDISRVYECAHNDKDIYFDLQTLTAFTPASNALYEVKFHIVQL